MILFRQVFFCGAAIASKFCDRLKVLRSPQSFAIASKFCDRLKVLRTA
ncbi:MAG: hypothetical protein MK111_00880 [Crocosphaera sp.]|nr:hypothetical protein [Crocosphaera sp.]MCH2243192.1 hypothetical protein [Crocosphaera sp.]